MPLLKVCNCHARLRLSCLCPSKAVSPAHGLLFMFAPVKALQTCMQSSCDVGVLPFAVAQGRS